MNNHYSLYKQVDVNTSSPLKIVLMLYDGALNFLKKSIECAENGDIKNKNIYANKTKDIISELNNSLNLEVGGEMAYHLKRLYFFMNRHLTQANLKNDTQGMKEVLLMLTDLREAWQEIYSQKENIDHQTYPQNDTQPYSQKGLTI